MSRIILMFVVLLSLNLALSAQVKLKIVIQDLDNNEGNVMVDLLNENEQHIKGYSGKVCDNECTIVADSLKPGKYAFRYFHDENSNNDLDTYWVGVPKEGYGFSNNAKGTFGPPKFKKTVFEVKNDTIMYCSACYIKF